MIKWTEKEALEYIIICGAEKIASKIILKKNGWSGLKACSAMDYLIKQKYTFRLIMSDKSIRYKGASDRVTGS